MSLLTEKEKEILHQIARSNMEAAVRKVPPPKIEGDDLSENLKGKRGGFVTLKKRGRLRGCIGIIFGVRPLYITVREMSRAAALEDSRFAPVEIGELPNLKIEISVLSPMERIKDVSKIEIGKHGLYIKRGWTSGVLLPQVPEEQGWALETFLNHTCMKANLPPDAWKYLETEIHIFSAEVF